MIILYVYIIGSLTCSLVYLILVYVQGQGLSQCHKPLVVVMFGVVQHIFGTKVSEAWRGNS